MTWWAGFTQIADGAVALLTALTLLFGGTWGLIVWANRRARTRAEDIKSDIRRESLTELARISDLEADVEGLKVKLGESDKRVETGFRDVDREIATLGRTVESLARKSDVGKLSNDVAGLSAALKASSLQVTMLFEATLRREEKERS